MTPHPPWAAAVRTAGLTKTFGRTTAVDGLDLRVDRGEIFGYVGPNGAGKTTTLRLLMGLLRPTAGWVHVFGRDVWYDAVAVHRAVGYVPGEPALYRRLTGQQHVSYLGALRGDRDPKRALAVANRLDLDLSRRAQALSRGNRQKLALVLALMSRPELLILDEPSTGLDPIVQQELHALLREHAAAGGSVLLSSHVLGEVQRIADRIGVLRAGRLVAVERIDELRAASLHHVTVRFDDTVTAAEFADVPGLRDLVVTARSVRCSARQPALDRLLKRISRHRIVDLECAEAELEETFLAYYGTGGADAA